MSFIKTCTQELNQQIRDIKSQLTSQIKCLEQRSDVQSSILHEINDFLKKRAEIDLEYSRQLEKLAKTVMIKHKNEKHKRTNWPFHLTCNLWQKLVDDTKEEAKKRGMIADIFGNQIVQSILSRITLSHKISKKTREVGVQAQSELIRVLTELQSAMKAYQLCYVDFNTVKEKLQNAELYKQKNEESNSLRKQKMVQKALDKRIAKFEAAKLKCDRARNEYLLCIDAANTALHKFYASDLTDLMDCNDLGFDYWMNIILTNIIAARKSICQQEMNSLASLSSLSETFQSSGDRRKFFELNSTAFMLPKPFEFKNDVMENCNHIIVNGTLNDDLKVRNHQINRRLNTLKQESDEILCELDKNEDHLRLLLSAATIIEIKPDGIINNQPPQETADSAIEETSINYVDKFRHHLLNGNLICRLEARACAIENSLKGSNPTESPSTSFSQNSQCSIDDKSLRKKKRLSSYGNHEVSSSNIRPKLFGGSLDEYLETTGEDIPIIVTSCIKILSKYALHHQGLFRIPGSQCEINYMKESFEKGEDPLQSAATASDINSIAGVLKLYLRELREPVFPLYLFERLTDCVNESEFVSQVRPLLNKLPQGRYLLLRYLFGFLNDISRYSNENMMDPSNLAICFGPTLLPIPDDKDQVYYQTSVNELIRNLIIKYDECFALSIPGPIYEPSLENESNYADESNLADDLVHNAVISELKRVISPNVSENINPNRRKTITDATTINERSLYEFNASANNILSPIKSFEDGDDKELQKRQQYNMNRSMMMSPVSPINTKNKRRSLNVETALNINRHKDIEDFKNRISKVDDYIDNNVYQIDNIKKENDNSISSNSPSNQSSSSTVLSNSNFKVSLNQRSEKMIPKMLAMPLTAQVFYQDKNGHESENSKSNVINERLMKSEMNAIELSDSKSRNQNLHSSLDTL